MKKLAVMILVLLSLPVVRAYEFTFSPDNYGIIEEPAFSWADMGNTTFKWDGYELNTTGYLYWAGVLVSARGRCAFSEEMAIVDGSGRRFYTEYGTSPTNGTLYLPLFEEDLYLSHYYNLSRGPYTFNITLKAENCEVMVRKFVFVTSRANPKTLPLKLVPPYGYPKKEQAIRSFEFANKTYWREFELNFTYIYRGGSEDVVNGWKSEPCPILSISNGKICLAERYCECYEENASLSPGIYRVELGFKEGNLSVRILEKGIVFEKSVHVRHPLYLTSLRGVAGNVSFRGVEGNASELFETPKDRQGYLIFAIALIIALMIAMRWRI